MVGFMFMGLTAGKNSRLLKHMTTLCWRLMREEGMGGNGWLRGGWRMIRVLGFGNLKRVEQVDEDVKAERAPEGAEAGG
jgi:hypothetical protein